MSIEALLKRIDTLLAQQQQERPPVEFQCFWGNEPIPQDGIPLIVTKWDKVILKDDEDSREP